MIQDRVVNFASSSEAMDRRVEEWLRRTQAQCGMSFSAWAEKAGIADTSVTRFLKHGKPTPKMDTLEALARAASVSLPSLGLTATIALVDIPLMLAETVRRSGWDAAKLNAVDQVSARARFAHCGAFVVTADTASLAGILPGDTVIVDPVKARREGALLVVIFDDGSVGAMRRVGDMLVPHAAGATAPMALASAEVLGVAVQVQRDLS